jgi:enamine deaminase RidA (YjgF/YER057c/UK114 family)
LNGAMENLETLLSKVGASPATLARINLYAATPEACAEARRLLGARLKCPVSAVVTPSPQPGALVALDAVAVATAKASPDPGNVRVFRSDRAVHISGMAAPGDMAAATRETLEKLGGVLDFLKIDRKDVVHVKSFLHHADDVAASAGEVAKFFNGQPPPATWVQWTMKDPIEIELVAQWDENQLGAIAFASNVTYETPPGVKPSPLYSRIAQVRGGRTIYTSGVYAGAKAPDASGETRLALTVLRELIKKGGGDFENLVKATYYPASDATSAALNQIRPEFYNPQRPPAASKAPVAHTGDADSKLTLDLIAVTPK